MSGISYIYNVNIGNALSSLQHLNIFLYFSCLFVCLWHLVSIFNCNFSNLLDIYLKVVQDYESYNLNFWLFYKICLLCPGFFTRFQSSLTIFSILFRFWQPLLISYRSCLSSHPCSFGKSSKVSRGLKQGFYLKNIIKLLIWYNY